MSTAMSEPPVINPLFAGAAAAAAHFLTENQGPEFSSITLDRFGSGESPTRILAHVSTAHPLTALADWAEVISEPTVTLTRRATYIAVTVETVTDDAPLILWAHLHRHEIAALWPQLQTSPDMDESTRLSPEILRAAAQEGST